jgi:hypothetical protein
MVLTAYFELSPVIGLSCHRRQQSYLHQFDAGVEASGPHDFAVRIQRLSSASAVTSTASRTNVRDDRDTPLLRVRDGESIRLFLPNREAKYFCKEDWTPKRPNSPSGKSVHRSHV